MITVTKLSYLKSNFNGKFKFDLYRNASPYKMKTIKIPGFSFYVRSDGLFHIQRSCSFDLNTVKLMTGIGHRWWYQIRIYSTIKWNKVHASIFVMRTYYNILIATATFDNVNFIYVFGVCNTLIQNYNYIYIKYVWIMVFYIHICFKWKHLAKSVELRLFMNVYHKCCFYSIARTKR